MADNTAIRHCIVSFVKIYKKVLLDCDWFISVQLIKNHSAIFVNKVQFSVITVTFSVITLNQSN